MQRRCYNIASLLLGILPLALLLHLYSLYLHAIFGLGRAPGFEEAPDSWSFKFHAFTVAFGLYFVAPAALVTVPLGFWWLHRQGTRVRIGLILFAFSAAFTYLALRSDPPALNWFRG